MSSFNPASPPEDKREESIPEALVYVSASGEARAFVERALANIDLTVAFGTGSPDGSSGRSGGVAIMATDRESPRDLLDFVAGTSDAGASVAILMAPDANAEREILTHLERHCLATAVLTVSRQAGEAGLRSRVLFAVNYREARLESRRTAALYRREQDRRRNAESFLEIVTGEGGISLFHQRDDMRFDWVGSPYPDCRVEEMVGSTDIELFAGTSAGHRIQNLKERAIETGEPIRRELRLRIGDEIVNWDFLVRPSRQSDGVVTAMIDRSEIRRIQRELDEARSDLRMLGSSVSHDLMTPLNALNINTEMVADALVEKDFEQVSMLLDRIRSNASHMTGMIRSLRTLSNVGKQEMEMRDVNLSDLAREALSNLRPKGEDIRYITVDKLPDVRGDAALLQNVFQNLISNALKFRQPGTEPTVRVGVETHGGQNVLFVRDKGIGFDQKRSERAFQLFSRLHPETGIEGTGAGLAIVHRIIQRHGGRVWVESEPGEGTTVYFTLHESDG